MCIRDRVLVSGLAPIRAKKLRYYEDRNFIGRVAAAPVLSEKGYQDRPAARPDDWGGQVRGVHMGLAAANDDGIADSPEDEGGLQRQRSPDLPDEAQVRSHAPEQAIDLGLDDDSDIGADKAAMERAQEARGINRAHAMNEGDLHHNPDRDLLPDF